MRNFWEWPDLTMPPVERHVGMSIGIDFGTGLVGIAWREGGKLRTKTQRRENMRVVLAELREAGARNAYVEFCAGGPGTQSFHMMLHREGFRCVRIDPAWTGNKMTRGQAARAAGAVPGTAHESDAAATLLYGESKYETE